MRAAIIWGWVALLASCQSAPPTGAPPPPELPRANTESLPRVWQEAAARGVTFRAVGQEPGWMLEITPNQGILLVTNYGMAREEFEYVEPTSEGGGRRYALGDGSTVVQVFAEPCRDIMSGTAYPATVVLTRPERAYLGCGRAL